MSPLEEPESQDERLDRLVADFSDALAAGREPDEAALLAGVPQAQRESLARCLRMVRAGLLPAPGATAALLPGVELAGYRIVRELGRGGMAIVYLATQIDLARPVALKVLRPGLALERRHVERFKREALTVARLAHPHIVAVHAVGETRGYHWLAMEYVEGPTLAEALERLSADGRPCREWSAADLARATGLPALDAPGASYERALCGLLAPVARALGTAHELGLVHRDVKPSNILIRRDGRALIADFGLAKGESDPGLSLSGEPLGTPFYMSPEQAALTARPVDQRSDVYSFGVTLYEALSGRRPFEGATVFAVLEAIQSRQPVPLRVHQPRASVSVQACVRRAMAREPVERYPSCLDLAADLTALAEGRATQAQAQEGGAWGRTWRALRQGWRGELTEYKSDACFLGLPLLHIHFNRRPLGQGRRVAKGWIAAGDVAIGGVACGGVTLGGISFGGMGAGLLTWAGVAVGLFPMGGLSLGGYATGGVAGGYAAFGGMAVGQYAMGGRAYGTYVLSGERRDAEAVEFFRTQGVPWMALMMGGAGAQQLLDDPRVPGEPEDGGAPAQDAR
jgi:serine/threonine protein kinase